MAVIDSIWVHGHDNKPNTITVHTKLKPDGRAQVKCELPADFYDALVSMAQAAADLHEQQMRAQILADTRKEKDHGNAQGN